MGDYVGSTLAAGTVKGVFVVVHAGASAEPGDWEKFLQLHEKLDYRACLVVSAPGFRGLSAAQRKDVSDSFHRRGQTPPVGVVTASPIHRGMITAMNWVLGGAMKAFSPQATERALAYVGVTTVEAQQAVAKKVAGFGSALRAATVGDWGVFDDLSA